MYLLILCHLVRLRGGGNNLLNYLLLLISDFTHPPFFITYLFIISCILFVVIFSLDSKRLFRILGAILFLIFGLLCSFGLYTILQKPLFEPRAFNGIGIYMSLILLSFVILESNRFLKRLSMAVIILFVYGLIIFANAYANALKAQQDYTKFRIELLLNDLQKVAPLDSSYDVTIPNFKNLQGINITESKKIKDSKLDSNIVVFTMQGNIGYAVPTIFTISRYGNIMKRLIPILMNGNFSHGLGLFYILLKSNYHPASFNKNEICENTENKELLLQNSYHSIQKAGKCIFITLYKGNE